MKKEVIASERNTQEVMKEVTKGRKKERKKESREKKGKIEKK